MPRFDRSDTRSQAMSGTLKGVRTGGKPVDPHPSRPSSAHLFLVLDASRPLAGGGRFALDGVQEVWIGRGAEVSAEREEDGRRLVIRVPDLLVSTRHARLISALGSWAVVDEDSTNGTYVDGTSIRGRTVLRDGAILEMGTSFFCVRTDLTTPHGSPLDVLRASGTGEPGLSTLLPHYGERLRALARVAASPVPILLLGESGSGKELLARAVHALSGRRGALVAINCGAVADALVESLLFGHMKGAFSGALRDEPGLVRSAHQGTLFLDEIGDMTSTAQASLLRALQEGEVTPVGATQPVKVDLRVVSATHRRVDETSATPDFRRDLYARLAGYTHEIPPVRDRPEDLGILVGDVLRRVAPAPEAVRLQSDAVRAMLTYSWPLNVRELQHALASAVALAGDAPLALAHLPASICAVEQANLRPSSRPPRPSTTEEQEIHASLVRAPLTQAAVQDDVSRSRARSLGRTRMQIHRWMRRFQVEIEKYRRPTG